MSAITTDPRSSANPAIAGDVIIDAHIRALYYGTFQAVRDTHATIRRGAVTAFIGPSGCGKSSMLRCFNRMNDQMNGFRLEGQVQFRGHDIYQRQIDPVAVRRLIGMVFQVPNPFAMSIAKNVAFGLRLHRYKGDVSQRVEESLKAAALWDEVKDKLGSSALNLSGGQQQRLCIARAIATEPDVLLMDEPCSSLDPIATGKIEELMLELKKKYTIVIVTHNLQQAKRVADVTGFMYVDTQHGTRTGHLVEYDRTETIFNNPRNEETRQYVRGAFG